MLKARFGVCSSTTTGSPPISTAQEAMLAILNGCSEPPRRKQQLQRLRPDHRQCEIDAGGHCRAILPGARARHDDCTMTVLASGLGMLFFVVRRRRRMQ